MQLFEYLLSFGTQGEFGRFRTTTSFSVQRGDRVVAKTYRGLEIAEVLREARPGHAHFLPNTLLGKLLRRATADDEARAGRAKELSQALFTQAQQIVAELQMPIAVLDAEVLLDEKQAFVHYLHSASFDEREVVSRLVKQTGLSIALHCLNTLADPKQDDEHAQDEEHAHAAGEGCGKAGCGQSEGGGCSTCSTGGGCSSCGQKTPQDVQAYFAGLRTQMEQTGRVPLANL